MTESIHSVALARYKQAEDFYGPARRQALEDLRFVDGEQWDVFNTTNQTQLTVNLVASFLRHITNEAKQNKPSINVSPTASGSSEDIAEIFAGLIRNIEQQSDASTAYGTAFWYAAAMGEGYFFIDRDYVSETSFDQELCIKTCDNPFKVYLDVNCGCVDGSDSDWGFIMEDMSKEEFKMKFPDSKMAESLASQFPRPFMGGWEDADTIRLARYFEKVRTPTTLHLIVSSTGQTFTSTLHPDNIQASPGETFQLISTRPSFEMKVMEHLMNAEEILESTEWPGKFIPIVRVSGDRFFIGDKLVTHGAVRMAKDPQRQYNYHTSVQTDMIDLAPKSAFIGATGQFANNPEKWANANTTNYGFLDYTPVYGQNGQPLPAPARANSLDGALFGAVSQSRMQSLEDLKLVFGVQDASLGRQGNEISGVAILARKEQSGVSNYHYYDNLIISIKYAGRQLINLIPKVYDADRTVRIIKPNQETALVLINSSENDFRYALENDAGYDIVIDTGPAYNTRRQEAVESMLALGQAYPQSLAVMSDLMVSASDWPMAKQVAARLKATIPANILAATGESTPGEDMAPAEQLAQARQQLSMLSMKAEQDKLELTEAKTKLKIAEDTSAMKLVELDMKNEQTVAALKHQRDVAAIEAQIKLKELELKERELEMKEKQLQIGAITAASGMADSMFKNMNPGGESLDADIGGKIG